MILLKKYTSGKGQIRKVKYGKGEFWKDKLETLHLWKRNNWTKATRNKGNMKKDKFEKDTSETMTIPKRGKGFWKGNIGKWQTTLQNKNSEQEYLNKTQF